VTSNSRGDLVTYFDRRGKEKKNLSLKMETCKECERPITEYNWCHDCSARHFQQNFNNWTSGNGNIDKFIQDTQLSAVWYNKLLEWIPFDRFNNIEHIGKGGFGDVYKAKWIDGRIWNWDNKNQNWNRLYQNEFVALKSLNNSENITLEYIKEVLINHKIFCNMILLPKKYIYLYIIFL
jgi:serine/threonine protein kinase